MQRWDPGAKVGITVAGGHGCGSGADQLSHPGADPKHGKQDGKTWEGQSGRCWLKNMSQVPFSHLIGLMFVRFYFLRKENSAISCCGFCGVPPRLWEFLSGYSCNHGLDTENLRVSFQF